METDSKNYPAADEIFGQILEASRFAHGPKHIKRAQYLCGWARLRRNQQEDAKAEPMLRESLEIARLNLDTTFSAFSERQQLAMTRDSQRMLFAYVDMAVELRQSIAVPRSTRSSRNNIANEPPSTSAVPRDRRRGSSTVIYCTPSKLKMSHFEAVAPPTKNR